MDGFSALMLVVAGVGFSAALFLLGPALSREYLWFVFGAILVVVGFGFQIYSLHQAVVYATWKAQSLSAMLPGYDGGELAARNVIYELSEQKAFAFGACSQAIAGILFCYGAFRHRNKDRNTKRALEQVQKYNIKMVEDQRAIIPSWRIALG
jgi:hypothetical protein